MFTRETSEPGAWRANRTTWDHIHSFLHNLSSNFSPISVLVAWPPSLARRFDSWDGFYPIVPALKVHRHKPYSSILSPATRHRLVRQRRKPVVSPFFPVHTSICPYLLLSSVSFSSPLRAPILISPRTFHLRPFSSSLTPVGAPFTTAARSLPARPPHPPSGVSSGLERRARPQALGLSSPASLRARPPAARCLSAPSPRSRTPTAPLTPLPFPADGPARPAVASQDHLWGEGDSATGTGGTLGLRRHHRRPHYRRSGTPPAEAAWRREEGLGGRKG